MHEVQLFLPLFRESYSMYLFVPGKDTSLIDLALLNTMLYIILSKVPEALTQSKVYSQHSERRTSNLRVTRIPGRVGARVKNAHTRARHMRVDLRVQSFVSFISADNRLCNKGLTQVYKVCTSSQKIQPTR